MIKFVYVEATPRFVTLFRKEANWKEAGVEVTSELPTLKQHEAAVFVTYNTGSGKGYKMEMPDGSVWCTTKIKDLARYTLRSVKNWNTKYENVEPPKKKPRYVIVDKTDNILDPQMLQVILRADIVETENVPVRVLCEMVGGEEIAAVVSARKSNTGAPFVTVRFTGKSTQHIEVPKGGADKSVYYDIASSINRRIDLGR